MKKTEKFVYLVCSENDNRSNDLLSIFDSYDKALKNIKQEFYGERIPRDQSEFNEKISIKDNGNEILFKMNKMIFMKIIKVKINEYSLNKKSIIIESLNSIDEKGKEEKKKIKNKQKSNKNIIEFEKFKTEIFERIKEFEVMLTK